MLRTPAPHSRALGCTDTVAILTEDQIQFLNRHGVPLSRVLDASGMGAYRRTRTMRLLDMEVAYGVTPCAREGHTLRDKYNHCLQCGTQNFAFARRYDAQSDVYVASSKSIGLVKIGCAASAAVRINTLNDTEYGGASDWTLQFSLNCHRAGRVEFATQSALWQYKMLREYERQGTTVTCQELFGCTPSVATKWLKSTAKKMEQQGAT